MKIHLSLIAEYCPEWGVWEVAREVITNALDSQDLGHPMHIRHHGSTLKVISEGVKLSTNVLLLGETSKSNREDQRGKFGEGFKIAMLVAARTPGMAMRIVNDDETWAPVLEEAPQFPGKLVLTVNTRKVQPTGKFTVEIEGVSKEAWEVIREKFLAITPARKTVKTTAGTILLEDRYAGHVFVKGIAIFKLEGLRFGYDLPKARIDRDRKMADTSDVKSAACCAWLEAAQHDIERAKDVMRMFLANSLDIQLMRWAQVPDVIGKALTEMFVGAYGDEAFPVTSEAMAAEVGFHGKRGIVVPEAYAEVMWKFLGNVTQLKEKLATEVVSVVSKTDLTSEELENWESAVKILNSSAVMLGYAPVHDRVEIVMFRSANMEGLWNPTGSIQIARKELKARSALLATLAHEIAHDKGADGEQAHERAEGALLANALDLLMFDQELVAAAALMDTRPMGG